MPEQTAALNWPPRLSCAILRVIARFSDSLSGGIRRWMDRPDDEEVTATRETGRRLIASNKRARHDYTILKTYEAGIVLIGNEVKSLRAGHASLVEAFVQEHDGELMLHGLHIPEHANGRYGTRALYQPRRTRKLLLHRSEIDKIIGRLGDAGVTVVALSLYFQDSWVKVEIALARGRRSFDKRQAIAQRDADREIARNSAIGCVVGGDGLAGQAEKLSSTRQQLLAQSRAGEVARWCRGLVRSPAGTGR